MSSSVNAIFTAALGYLTFGIGIALMSHPNSLDRVPYGPIMVILGSLLLAQKSK